MLVADICSALSLNTNCSILASPNPITCGNCVNKKYVEKNTTKITRIFNGINVQLIFLYLSIQVLSTYADMASRVRLVKIKKYLRIVRNMIPPLGDIDFCKVVKVQ